MASTPDYSIGFTRDHALRFAWLFHHEVAGWTAPALALSAGFHAVAAVVDTGTPPLARYHFIRVPITP